MTNAAGDGAGVAPPRLDPRLQDARCPRAASAHRVATVGRTATIDGGVVMTSDPAMLRDVLRRPDEFPVRIRTLLPGRFILANRERAWKRLRSAVWQYFSAARLAEGRDDVARSIRGALPELASLDDDALAARLRALALDVYVDTICEGLRGSPGQRILRRLGSGSSSGRQTDRARSAVVNIRWMLAFRRIAKRGGADDDLLSALLDVQAAAESVTQRDVRQVIGLMATNLMHVSGPSLAWALRCMADHPEAVAWVRDGDTRERSEHFGREVLRHAQMITALVRRCSHGADTGAWSIASESLVVLDLDGMHQDAELWGDDAAEFRPQRWAEERLPHAPHAYLPYSAGPRMCTGARVADMLLITFIETVVSEADVAPTGESGLVVGAVTEPKPLAVRITSRG